jgi:hypothetical protein
MSLTPSSGGYGTNGGSGGDGGHIEINLTEDDMDLLVAVKCVVNQGQGGRHGVHGQGGRGGSGGLGGKSYSW